MTKKQLTQELATLAASLLKSALILYRMYGPIIKTVLALLIAYIAFHLGRKTVVDKIEEDVKRVQAALKDRAKYAIQLPERLQNIAKIRKTVLVVSILAATFVFVSLKLKFKPLKAISTVKLFQSALITLFTLIGIWTYELVLSWQIQKGRRVTLQINEQLFSLMKQAGPRAETLLRTILCKQKIMNRKKRPAGVCSKDNCKQERLYLKSKSQLVEKLVAPALTFEWCSICTYRSPFDQFLGFESQQYVSPPEVNEEQEVAKKNEYLINEIERISSWIKSVSPCNCSKIYWVSQLKQIKVYKESDKQLEEHYNIHKNRKHIRVL